MNIPNIIFPDRGCLSIPILPNLPPHQYKKTAWEPSPPPYMPKKEHLRIMKCKPYPFSHDRSRQSTDLAAQDWSFLCLLGISSHIVTGSASSILFHGDDPVEDILTAFSPKKDDITSADPLRHRGQQYSVSSVCQEGTHTVPSDRYRHLMSLGDQLTYRSQILFRIYMMYMHLSSCSFQVSFPFISHSASLR